MVNFKSLAYGFMMLPYVKREAIILKLSLREEEDKDLKHIDILNKIIQMAEEQKCVDKLWEEINNGINS
jgi:hypothetical protein